MDRRNALKWLTGAGLTAIPAAANPLPTPHRRGLPELEITDVKAILTAPPAYLVR